jgi:hypothetical protein|tara:strand:- start:288 stop:722 length:435 start_codon:yes stop_codon:yes gene_type:complete
MTNEIDEVDKAYIAGLFDGEGSITYKKYPERKKKGNKVNTYNCWRISMEIAMTDKSVLNWLHEVLGVGTLASKKVNGKRVDGTSYLKQWRWRCTFRDTYYVCLLIWPFAHTKLPKINKILDHYYTLQKNNIVDIRDYVRREKNV